MAVVGVPPDVVDELKSEGLASPLPVLRGTGLEAVVTLGMDSATLVTLLQAPDSIQAFARWICGRCRRADNTIDINAKRGSRRLHLRVDGDMDVDIVADFLAAALANERAEP